MKILYLESLGADPTLVLCRTRRYHSWVQQRMEECIEEAGIEVAACKLVLKLVLTFVWPTDALVDKLIKSVRNFYFFMRISIFKI